MKHWLIGSLILGVGLASSAIAHPLPAARTFQVASADAEHLIAQSKAERRSKHYRAAVATLERALEQFPGDYDVLMAMGRLKDYLGDYEEAVKYYKKCLAERANDFDAQVMLAHAYVMDDKYERARELCEKLNNHPGKASAGAWYRSELVNTLGAAEGLKAQREGVFAMIRYGLGVRHHFERAIEIDPENSRARFALSRYYLEAPGAVGGNPKRGTEMMAQAAKMDPEDWVIRGYYCRGLFSTSHPNAKEQAARFVEDFSGIAAAKEEYKDIVQKAH